jgi:hypothetical protein
VVGEGRKCLEDIASWETTEETSFSKLVYLVDTLAEIFSSVFKDIKQPFEYEAMVLLSENARLAQLGLDILEWRNPCDRENRLRYPWLEDLKIGQKNKKETVI